MHGGPADHKGQVVQTENPDLDWSKTIFFKITDPKLLASLKERFGQRCYWSDAALMEFGASASVGTEPDGLALPRDLRAG